MSKETREYAKQLVSQMTLEEKMSQMVYQSPAIERLGIPAYNWWNEGLHGPPLSRPIWAGGTDTFPYGFSAPP